MLKLHQMIFLLEDNFVKTSNNEIYAFGCNDYSQLGAQLMEVEQTTPICVFTDIEDIWYNHLNKSRAKSARK